MNAAQRVAGANHRVTRRQLGIELHQRQLVIKRLQMHARFVGQYREQGPRNHHAKHVDVVALRVHCKGDRWMISGGH